MKRNLRMKCSYCGHWNRVPVNKLFVERLSPEPKVKIMIPMYKPLKESKCDKCGKIIAKPKELIRVVSRK
ncbi:MAG: hypothetical protein QXQ94_10285 [Candidatus Bathyarchaeia archaeon]